MANETKGKRANKSQGDRRNAVEDLLGNDAEMSSLTGSDVDRRGFVGNPDDR